MLTIFVVEFFSSNYNLLTVASMKLSMEQYRRDNLSRVVWDKMQTQVLVTIVHLSDINT